MGKLLVTLQKNTQAILMIVLVGIMLALVTPPASVAKASSDEISFLAVNCSCVVYVKNTLHLIGTAGNAKDMGPYLIARGYHKVTTPREGDVIIMKPGFHGANAISGHVGIIKSVVDKGSSLEIRVRGASQPGPTWVENNCNNVSFWGGITYLKSDSRVSYYRHN